MPNQTLLIKPASGNCNLNCKYCFYSDVAKNREVQSYGMMSTDTLENIVKKAFLYADQYVGFAFQGGEPTLIGLEFYEKLIEYVDKYNENNIKVSYSIQTNGIIIDSRWARFLVKHNFLVGLSIDGTKEIHDLNRIDKNGLGSYKQVEKTVKLLKEHRVEFNILSVVNKAVAKHPLKIYNHFKKNDIKYLQFIPCLDPFNEVKGNRVYSLTPEDYGDFLCKLFDEWYKDIMNDKHISIRFFDNIVLMLMGYPPESCDMRGRCSVNAVIESDGSVYPCDFYVMDEWRMGNINTSSFDTILNSDIGKKFTEISFHMDETCQACMFKQICRSGCRRHKEPIIDGRLSTNYFCKSYKKFYNYTLSRFKDIIKHMN